MKSLLVNMVDFHTDDFGMLTIEYIVGVLNSVIKDITEEEKKEAKDDQEEVLDENEVTELQSIMNWAMETKGILEKTTEDHKVRFFRMPLGFYLEIFKIHQ